MKIFVTKSINLILIIGIVYVYCTQAGKLKKNMADAGRAAQSHFADDGVYEGSGDGFGGKITVRLTVKNERLQKAEIISAKNETKAAVNRCRYCIGCYIIIKRNNSSDEGCTRKRKGTIDKW